MHADTNDPALDPALTAEDTQHTLQSILTHSGPVALLPVCLTICPTVSLFLSLMPIFHSPFTSVV